MPLTSAERQARRRQKLKDEGRYNEFKRKMVDYKRKRHNKRKEEETKLPTALQVDIAEKEEEKLQSVLLGGGHKRKSKKQKSLDSPLPHSEVHRHLAKQCIVQTGYWLIIFPTHQKERKLCVRDCLLTWLPVHLMFQNQPLTPQLLDSVQQKISWLKHITNEMALAVRLQSGRTLWLSVIKMDISAPSYHSSWNIAS